MTVALDHLLASMIAGLPEVPGVDSARLFGSMATNTHDELSDIDVVVFVVDVEAAWTDRYRLVHRIAPVLLELPLRGAADDRASTFLFRSTGLAHKLDIGYLPVAERDRWIACNTSSVLWPREGCEGFPERDISTFESAALPIMAPRDPAIRAILDQLIGVTRYVKARKREQVLVAWRFATALAEATLAFAASELLGRPYPGRKLTTPEYLELHRMLPLSAHASLLGTLFMANVADMDERVVGWVKFLGQMVDRSSEEDEAVRAALADLITMIERDVASLAREK
jgi:predicted nucleotidyltransferase